MALNLDSVGKSGPAVERSWTASDVLLYALAVGAGQADPAGELQFTTENSDGVTTQVLPSFANMLGFGGGFGLVGEFDLSAVLHGEQAFELHKPLPVAGTARTVSTVAGIYDKGKAAVVVVESATTDAATGELLATVRNATFIRGAGGFGGERGPAPAWAAPERDPDFSHAATIPHDQALLYRLTGDRNPLHSDPVFARKAGFDRPILHGMCTYGYTARILLHEACESRVERFAAMSGRFASPVYPGDSITVEGWEDGPTVYFRTRSNGAVAIDHGVLRRS
ncbi:MAG TPA: MaoC/PaaZ C-terminal domain-containing protein, partial [Streptosporangiaceae bacterium]|nr:MaoC/PaaZ C-terminal domain-containing protein [Streptosporangiaceae bacterium]